METEEHSGFPNMSEAGGWGEMPPWNSNRRRSIRKVRVLDTQVTLPLSVYLRRRLGGKLLFIMGSGSFIKSRNSSREWGRFLWLFNDAASR
jgi:hypothetical protein